MTVQARHRWQRPAGPWVALLVLPIVTLTVPSALVMVGPLQSNGWPARLLIFWIVGAVALGWLAHRRPIDRSSPSEVGLWLFGGGLLASYAAVGLRVVTDEESAGALRAALVMFPLVVVALAISGTATRRRVDLLLMLLVVGLSFSALVALAQTAAPFNFAEVIRPPGMTAREIGGFGTRGEFTRVKGAATHPIELSVMAGALLPVGIHFGRFARTHRLRVLFTALTALMIAALVLSISRSGIVVVVISMTVYSMVLNARQRANILVLALVGAVITRAAVPGLLGAVRGMFVHIDSDDSIAGRTNDYEHVEQFFAESPVVGHGLGTFRPEMYFYLDNQYLMALIEGGLVLTVATIVFMLLAIASARGARQRATTAVDVSRAQAVTAAVASIATAAVFFDLFSFAQVSVVLFILVGIAGALWHDSRAEGRPIASPMARIRTAREGVEV